MTAEEIRELHGHLDERIVWARTGWQGVIFAHHIEHAPGKLSRVTQLLHWLHPIESLVHIQPLQLHPKLSTEEKVSSLVKAEALASYLRGEGMRPSTEDYLERSPEFRDKKSGIASETCVRVLRVIK